MPFIFLMVVVYTAATKAATQEAVKKFFIPMLIPAFFELIDSEFEDESVLRCIKLRKVREKFRCIFVELIFGFDGLAQTVQYNSSHNGC